MFPASLSWCEEEESLCDGWGSLIGNWGKISFFEENQTLCRQSNVHHPQVLHALIPEAEKYVILQGKRDFVDTIR